jgi:hypothetical protein
MGGSCPTFCSSSRVVKLDGETFVRALPAKDIRAGGKSDIGYGDRRLDEKVVRVFAVGRVTRSDKNDACNEFAVRINDAGGGSHLGFYALLLDGGTQWQNSFKFSRCGGAPTRFDLDSECRGSECRSGEYREKENERQLHRGSLI